MSKTKNDGLDLDGTEPFEKQQFGTVSIEGVKTVKGKKFCLKSCSQNLSFLCILNIFIKMQRELLML